MSLEVDAQKREDISVLEQFIVDNEELQQLEATIGRFNIFDALRVDRAEIRHSNFLAWLLDPAESHGQGSLFLTELLKDLFRQSPVSLRPFSPLLLDREQLHGVQIRREWNNIDILIECVSPRFVVAIENKIGAREHGKQLAKYQRILDENYPGVPRQFVFLTTEGSEASEATWVPYTYADVHRVLSRVRTVHASSIGDDVLSFLDHYLRLIGSRFMDDPKINDLCWRIYRNHRQALELLFEYVGSPWASVVNAIKEHLGSEPSRWHVFNTTGQRIDFVPTAWLSWLPPIGVDRRLWMTCHGRAEAKGFFLTFEVWNTSQPELRHEVVKTLGIEGNSFGFNKPWLAENTRWNRLLRKKVVDWMPDQEPDAETVVDSLKSSLNEFDAVLSRVPEVVQPIVRRLQTPSA